MKITKKTNDGCVAFEELKQGDIFEADGMIYMKIQPIYLDRGSSDINAIYMCDGDTAWFQPNERVKLCKAELIVE